MKNKERSFKWRLLWMMILIKIVTVGFLLFEWDTGGYGTNEMLSCMGLLVPLFTMYTTVMLKELNNTLYKEDLPAPENQKTPIGSTKGYSYFVIMLYGIAIFGVLLLKPLGIFSFANTQLAIGGIEGLFGIYLGDLIFKLFKKKES